MNTFKTMKMLAAVLTSSALFTPALNAAQAGDMIVRAGLATVSPASDNGPVVKVDDAQGLGLSLTYMLTPSLGLELLGASPFNHDIQLASDRTKIGEADHLPPTLLLNYHFSVAGPISAYLGAGINHTFFFEEKIDAAVAQDLSLSSSTGLALQLGTDFQLTPSWSANLAWWSIDIDTDATLSAADGSSSKTKVEIDPNVLMLGFAYRF